MSTTTAAALTVDCPTCFATIGDPCRSRPKNHIKGAPMPTCPPHATRVKRAAEVAAAAPKKARKAKAAPATGGERRPQSSHKDCDHPSTKAGRAACRRERAKAAAAV